MHDSPEWERLWALLCLLPNGHPVSSALGVDTLLHKPVGRLGLLFRSQGNVQHGRQLLDKIFRTFNICQVRLRIRNEDSIRLTPMERICHLSPEYLERV
jgi:hypothetical protein